MNSESDCLEDIALHLDDLVMIKLAMTGLIQQNLSLYWGHLLEFRSN